MNKLFNYIFDRKWLLLLLLTIGIATTSGYLNHFIFDMKTFSPLQTIYLSFVTSSTMAFPIIRLWADFNKHRELKKELEVITRDYEDAIQAHFQAVLERTKELTAQEKDNANH